MDHTKHLAKEHARLTRRYFLGLGATGAAAMSALPAWAKDAGKLPPELVEVVAELEYLTREENFRSYGRGNPPPWKLPEDKKREVGLVRDTWKLEVVADPESDAKIERPLTKESGTALNWKGLMKLAETKAVRYMHVTTCTNDKRGPCGMGLWEGVPLREVIWMVRPAANVRRVFYYGYHNDDPKQRFQSSVTMGRVLEDPPGEQPILLAYKRNGRFLTSTAGGPVRMFVPEAYGNKSVKWLQRIVLTNTIQLNDTYATWNNDTESRLKTFARFIHAPKKAKAGEPIAVTGLAQVGISGLSKVQYWLQRQAKDWPEDDPYFAKADWNDAEVLPPPKQWGGDLPDGKLPPVPSQIDPATGKPRKWPMRNAIVHWAVLVEGVKPGLYDLRCRTIDANGIAQPMPRPFLKSGSNAIQKVGVVVAS